jgi:hypothetical protein
MEKCTVELTKDNIIARSKTFDKHYVIVNNMLSQSGFGWDDDKNMISVEDDVWNNYAKVISISVCMLVILNKFAICGHVCFPV